MKKKLKSEEKIIKALKKWNSDFKAGKNYEISTNDKGEKVMILKGLKECFEK